MQIFVPILNFQNLKINDEPSSFLHILTTSTKNDVNIIMKLGGWKNNTTQPITLIKVPVCVHCVYS